MVRFYTQIRIFLLVAILAVGGDLFAGANGFYYNVKPNESMSILASRFGISVRDISSANRLQVNTRLVPGARLWIPAKAPAASASTRPNPTPVLSASTSVSRPRIDTSKSRSSSRPIINTSTRTETKKTSGYVFTDKSVYIVQRGDSLWNVAKDHGLSVEELARMNGIGSRDGLLIVKPSANSSPAVRDIPGGGIETKSRPTVTSTRTTESSSRSIPQTRPSSKGYIWPVEGRVIRRFTHKSEEKYMGIDVAVPRGTEVRAAKEGKVVYADEISFYGKMVVIEHDGNYATCYGQLSRLLVSKGQKIRQGQVIGRSGEGGRGSDDYMHFELRRNGEAINPEPYLP